jgi:hypothetical protein
MNLAPIVARAREKAVKFRLVDFALTAELLKARGIPTLPALMVMPLADAPQPNRLATGAIHQATTWTWRAYIYVKSARQDFGGDLADELQPLRESLRDAWHGWQPEGADGVIELGPGRVASLGDGILVWQDDFNVKSYYRKVGT